MTLLEKQLLFTRNVGLLIGHVYESGYGLTFGEAFRTSEQAALNELNGSGIKNSLHGKRLAVDLQLFREKEYLKVSDDYESAGKYWLSLHPLNRWGGDFAKQDGNHFSMEHEGVK